MSAPRLPPLNLLIDALATDGACYVLGAGASAPHVPTIGQLPDRIGAFVHRLGSFSAIRPPDSALRRLIAPLIDRAMVTSSLDEWKLGAMTADSIAIALEQLICVAHWQRLPQYDLFQLLPSSASVVSFNWDGLAASRCTRQSTVLHPHGCLPPRLPYMSEALDDQFYWSQEGDSPLARYSLLAGFVFPGEEESPEHSEMRERVFTLWREAKSIVVIGYSFGLASGADYDTVWRDAFLEAMRYNNDASIHVIAPDTEMLRSRLVDQLGRAVNVHGWPLNWYWFARAVGKIMRDEKLRLLLDLRPHIEKLDRAYRENVGRPVHLPAVS